MLKIIILVITIFMVSGITNFCSSYCATCNGTTPTSCNSCPNNFTINSSYGCTPVGYNITYEQLVVANYTLNTTCGAYVVVGNIVPMNVTILSAYSFINTNGGHFKVRVMGFIIWLNNTFVASDTISIFIDGAPKASSAYSANSTTLTVCNAVPQKAYTLDTGQVSHNAAAITVIIGCNSSTASLNWGFKQILVLTVLCDISCTNCTNNALNCSACNTGYFLYSVNTSCLASCPTGYFNSSATACSACTGSNCASCNGTATNCTSCVTTAFLLISNACTSCTAPCANCSITLTNCTSCVATALLSGNTCTTCTAPCATCSGTLTNCTTCASNYLIASSNTCNATCPTGFRSNGATKKCDACYTGCSTCTGTTINTCTGCIATYFLSANICYANSCPNGFYNNTASGCAACTAPCTKCSVSATNCTSCNSTTYYIALNNTCVASCPTSEGYITNNATNICDPCYIGCLTCLGIGMNQCLACTNISGTTYFLNGSTCYANNCPTGTYNSSQNGCSLCLPPCGTCSILNNNCTSCNLTTYFMTSNNTCLTNCPNGYFADNSTNTCQKCNAACLSCTGISISQCNSCANISSTIYLLYNNQCLITCPVSSYPNTLNNLCINCLSPCFSCSLTNSNCTSCVTGYLLGGNICNPCLVPCLTCSILLSNCTSCVSNTYYLTSPQGCTQTCPQGYAANITTNNCDICSVGCATCTNSSINGCTTCTNISGVNYYLNDTSCLISCPSGYYNNTPNSCTICPNICVTCNSNINCNSCISGYLLIGYSCTICTAPCLSCSVLLTNCTSCNFTTFFLASSNSCGTTCPIGFAGNNSTNNCDTCSLGCYSCTNSSSDGCTACTNVSSTIYVLNGTSCLTSCPSGYYNNTANTCSICNNPCATCSLSANNCTTCVTGYLYNGTNCNLCTAPCATCSITITNCTSCASNYYISSSNSCEATCPTGYAANISTNNCDICSTGCLTCTNGSNNGCTACTNISSTNYYLNGTSCLVSCPIGTFNNTPNTCSVCTAPCASCISSATICLSCTSNYFFTGSVCTICSNPCASCSKIATNCTSCNSTTYYIASNNTCPVSCPAGFVNNASTRNCDICNAACSTCTGTAINQCTACRNVSGTVYYLNGTTCMISCPTGYFNNTPNGCSACSAGCTSCGGINSNCYSCTNGYVLSGYTCNACTAPCATCSVSQTNCTSCTINFYVASNNTCSASCPSGFISNSSTHNCDQCYIGCSLCTNALINGCTACTNVAGINYFLNGTTCYLNCPTGYYNNTANTCTICPAPCLTCISLNNCTTCVTGYLYNGTNCNLCTAPCATCSITITNCTSCASNYYISSSNSCEATCPTGYAANSSTHNCDICSTGCLTCTNASNNGCTACTNISSTNYYLNGTSCLVSCPIGTFNNTPNTCTICSNPCASCQKIATNCTSCNSTTYYIASNNTCPVSCPAGFVNNASTRNCDICNAACSTCTGTAINQCTACRNVSGTVYYLNGTTCMISCPTGYFNNTPNGCSACSAPCASCVNIGTNCISCNVGYLLNVNICVPCTAPCASCSNTVTNCTSCNSTTYYIASNNTCPASCPAGFVNNASTHNCDSCNPACLVCSGTAINQCSACTNVLGTPYYLNSTTCMTSCPTGYYNNTPDTCAICTAPCATCVNIPTNCTSCLTNYYVSTTNTCPATCPTGFIGNSTTHNCDPCTIGCSVCANTSINGCTTCMNVNGTIYYMNLNTCLLSCPAGFYNNTANACAVCNAACATCVNLATYCLSCNSGYINPPTCTPCTAPCATCITTITTCTSCLTNFYLDSSNSCPATCPLTYIQNATTRNCDSCSTGCSTCTGTDVNQCSTCIANYYLNGTSCYITCPATTYQSTSTNCAICTPPCANCFAAATTCTSCVIGYALVNNACICTVPCVTCSISPTNCTSCNSTTFYTGLNQCNATCSSGYYANTTTRNCDFCFLGCATCTNSSANGCTACTNVSDTVYFLNGTFCLTSCPNGYYNNTGNSCAACNANCTACSVSATNCSSCISINFIIISNLCTRCTPPCATCSNSITNCTSCNATTFYMASNNSCGPCPTGYLSNSSTNNCDLCTIGCSVCNGTQINQCLYCGNISVIIYYLYSGTCSISCPFGFVGNLSNNLCVSCSQPCITCSNTPSNCTSCNSTTFYQSNLNLCSTTCPVGYAANPITHNCDLCNVACPTCIGASINACLSCTNVSGIIYLLSGSSCVTSCPTGSYNNSANTCASCSICFTCSITSTNCTSCSSGFYLSVNSCLSCNVNCLNCTGTATNCTACGTGKVLMTNNGTCATGTTCITGFYLNVSNNNCFLCDSSCTVCTGNPYPCSTCASGYSINVTNSACCSIYFFINSTTNSCQSCSTNCINCTNSTTCNQCISNNYLYNNLCYNSCPVGSYVNSSKTCNSCDSKCTTCNVSSTNCSVCANGFVLISSNFTCIGSCPKGTYLSGSNCILCNSNCSTCQNSSTNCSACNLGYYYFTNNTCLNNCPNGFYKSNTLCINCSSNCNVCLSNTLCITCNSLYYLSNGTCSSSCLTGYYTNSSYICYPCDINCSICTNSSTNCSACATNYFFISSNNTCLNSCPTGTFLNASNSTTCNNCNSQCFTCSNISTNCTSCGNSNFLYNNTCLTSCPINYFADSSINNCSSCNSSCSLCVKNSNNCLSCVNNYYYIPVNNICTTNCPENYTQNHILYQCLNCSSSGYASYCVSLTINVYTSDTSNSMSPIYADLNFSQNINFTTFPYQTFQTISFSNPNINTSMFNITYNITSNSSYRIILMPNGTGIQYNVQIYVKTVNFTQSYYSTTNNIFSNSVYGMYNFTNWTYQYCNCTSSTQNQIMTSMSQLSSSMNNIQSGISFLYELKKFGFIFLIMNSLQITTCLILINTLLPNNLYTTLQIMSIFIFPQNHPQQTKGDPTVIFGQNIIYYTGSYRLLPFANNRLLSLQEFTFNRSGFTSYFIFDAYAPIISIIICYVLLAICKCNFLTRVRPIVQTLLYRLHQIAILYFTLTIIFQFQYITVVNTYRYLSILTCLVVTIYFTLYHAYIFYDFMPYPKVEIQTQQFDYYVMKYGNLLRNIRYEDYPDNQGYALLKNWIRPYNYHTISFIKKFAMMIALVVFYDQGLNQILALMFIQVAEIFRFYYTWPFYSKARNIIRLFLEFVLLGIFSLILSSDLIYKQMMANPQTISQLGSTYYSVGWIAISLIILFTVMHLCVFIFDLVYCVKSSNKERMHQIRLDFYNKKFKNYERLESKDYVRINDMIKRGIVEPIKFSDLPSIEVRIQQYEISLKKNGLQLEIDINKITEIRMANHAFINKNNANIKVTNKISYKTNIEQNQKEFQKFSELINMVDVQYAYSFIFKTYLTIPQNQYRAGEIITFDKQKMRNEIYIIYEKNSSPIMKYKGQLLKEFPIPEDFINKLLGNSIL